MNVTFPADTFDSPASVEAAGPDEFYLFEGDPDYPTPAYWVARFGTTVFSRVNDDLLERSDYDDYPDLYPDFLVAGPLGEGYARAAFAEATCDPEGPGCPQEGDLVEVYYDGSDEPEVEEVFACEPVHDVGVDGVEYVHHFRIELDTDIVDVEPHRLKIVYRPAADGDE